MGSDRLEFGDHGEMEDDEAAKLADDLDLEEGVTEALYAAEDTARRAGEEALAECLARLEMLWAIGGLVYAVRLLDRARDACLQALRKVTDEELT
jgi:hypothetical protein